MLDNINSLYNSTEEENGMNDINSLYNSTEEENRE